MVEPHIHDDLSAPKNNFSDLVNVQQYAVVRKIPLTAAQVKALNTTPITLVPAPGANSVVIVDSVTSKVLFNTTAYTGANNLEFRYTGAAGAKVTADMANTFINSGATAYDSVAGVATELTPVANAPIVVRVPTANPAAGDSTISFIIKYRVVSF